MASVKDSWVTRTSFRPASSTLPTKKVSLRSPTIFRKQKKITSCTILSISSVVTPTATALAASSKTSLANLQATFNPAISSSVKTFMTELPLAHCSSLETPSGSSASMCILPEAIESNVSELLLYTRKNDMAKKQWVGTILRIVNT
uniref:Uncharacterized protein n=1 Tax=Romanomermis culicivorax TaxID=13658 RepID=A0A915IPJ3_ROMCU